MWSNLPNLKTVDSSCDSDLDFIFGIYHHCRCFKPPWDVFRPLDSIASLLLFCLIRAFFLIFLRFFAFLSFQFLYLDWGLWIWSCFADDGDGAWLSSTHWPTTLFLGFVLYLGYYLSVNALLVLTFWGHFYFSSYIFILPFLVSKPINAWHLSLYCHLTNIKSWRGKRSALLTQ